MPNQKGPLNQGSEERYKYLLKENKNLKDLGALLSLLEQDLLKKNYKNLLDNLRLLGRSFKKIESSAQLLEDDNFRSLLTQISENKQSVPTDEDSTNQKLMTLSLVLLAWNDSGLPREEKSQEGENHKKLRQLLKFKQSLDKNDRSPIHLGLSALVLYLIPTKETLQPNLRPSDLIELIFDQIELKGLDEKEILNELKKIGLAISSFQTPNKKKKFVKYAGILLAFVAALASGLATGGAIILLFPSFSILALTLGGLIALFGFIANFGFFSQNFPNFMLSLLKKGGISEYIDNEGKRQQFSVIYKYLLMPLAIFASLTVGIGTTALTYMTILGLVTQLLPMLAVIWPPLPVLIVGILALSIGVILTVAVLTATLESLKKVAALNMGFKALCQYAYKNSLKWFKNLNNLKTHEKVGVVIMLFLIPIALAGLAYFRYTAGVDLSIFIGVAGSIVMGVVAYIAQIAFTCLSVNKLKNALIKPFSSVTEDLANQSIDDTQPFVSKLKSVLSNVSYWSSLFFNAMGNAVLVFTGSLTSIFGAIACGLNSFTGNMSEPDTYHAKREAATQGLVNILIRKETITQNDQPDMPIVSNISLHLPQDNCLTALTGTSSAPTTPTTPTCANSNVSVNTPTFFKFTSSTGETRHTSSEKGYRNS